MVVLKIDSLGRLVATAEAVETVRDCFLDWWEECEATYGYESVCMDSVLLTVERFVFDYGMPTNVLESVLREAFRARPDDLGRYFCAIGWRKCQEAAARWWSL